MAELADPERVWTDLQRTTPRLAEAIGCNDVDGLRNGMLLAWVNYAILQELEDAAESAPEAIKKLKRIATEAYNLSLAIQDLGNGFQAWLYLNANAGENDARAAEVEGLPLPKWLREDSIGGSTKAIWVKHLNDLENSAEKGIKGIKACVQGGGRKTLNARQTGDPIAALGSDCMSLAKKFGSGTVTQATKIEQAILNAHFAKTGLRGKNGKPFKEKGLKAIRKIAKTS